MNFMFYDAKSFNQDISKWNVSNVTDMSGMFYKAKLLIYYYYYYYYYYSYK
jgi:surface protein